MITQYDCPDCKKNWKREGETSNELKVVFHLCPNCSEKVKWYKAGDEGFFCSPISISKGGRR